jgi:transposase
MLTAACHMLKDGTFYHDLGADHFDRRAKGAATKRLIANLESLGYDVQITPLAA